MNASPFDQRPLIVALAGSNGAGKTTFYYSHLKSAGLRFVNADVLAYELNIEPYAAAKVADAIRRELVRQRESFVFETVFSDPVGDKVTFLKEATQVGYNVVLCFIAISSPQISEQRVAMRVTQGAHNVPAEKLRSRYPRTLANLKSAIQQLPHVLIFDNDSLCNPYRQVAVFDRGIQVAGQSPIPRWLKRLLK